MKIQFSQIKKFDFDAIFVNINTYNKCILIPQDQAENKK